MPVETSEHSGAPVGDLKQIRVDEIAPNPRNPRQTFNPTRIEQLAASLQEIGLQVPITVYENPRRTRLPYVLLDGERRFRAAKLNNWITIPAQVVPPPSGRENAVRMFNIHMLREDWEEIETAWALEQIIEETGVDSDRELQEITRLSIDRIRNMRRVLSFPRSVQEKVASGELQYNLLVELDKNVLAKSREKKKKGSAKPITDLSTVQLRDVFLKKYTEKTETDVVDLRKVGTLFDTARGSGKVAERATQALTRLVTKPDITIEEAFETGAASSVELGKVLRDMKGLPGRVKDLLGTALEPDQRKEVQESVRTLRARLADLIRG
jgi:ParB/RepB/Spo0J family partition protein